MPTGTCRYPEHHGPSAGPPIGLLLAIVAGALIITHLHTVIVTLAVVAILAVAAAAVAALWHSHRATPYDAAWSATEPQDAPQLTATVHPLAVRVAELERQLAERPAIEAPQQHLHLHGVSAEDMAAVLAMTHQQEHHNAAPLPLPLVSEQRSGDQASPIRY